jgi:TFIIH p62 subunit, N-terminal domain
MTDELDDSLHHEDVAKHEENGDDRDNHSFMTVDWEDDHPQAKAAAAAIGDTKTLLDKPLDIIMTATRKNGDKHNSSVYEKVKYHDDIGKLVLTDVKITFHPYDGGAPTRGSFVARNHEIYDGSHSWRWTMIQKHQVSPNTSTKTKLRLVSKDSKSVVFTFYNREQMHLIRKDVSRHLKQARIAEQDIKKEGTSENIRTGINHPTGPLGEAHEATALLGGHNARADQARMDEGDTARTNFHIALALGVVALIFIGMKVIASGASARFLSWTDCSLFSRALSLAPTDDALQGARVHGSTLEYLRNNLRG